MIPEITPAVRTFLESMCVPGVLSTLGKDGAPVTSAVWFGFFDGDVIISTPADRPKARNARADARVSFLVDTKEMPYRGVAIEGEAEVIEDPDEELVAAIARRYLGPELSAWMGERRDRGERVVLRIRAQRVRPWNITPQVAP